MRRPGDQETALRQTPRSDGTPCRSLWPLNNDPPPGTERDRQRPFVTARRPRWRFERLERQRVAAGCQGEGGKTRHSAWGGDVHDLHVSAVEADAQAARAIE